MALTIEERERIRTHLGFPSLANNQSPSLAYGVPIMRQQAFLIEDAMTRLLPEAEPRVRNILTTLDGIECRMLSVLDQITVDQVDSIRLAPDGADRLEREYNRWGRRLAEIFHCEFYTLSARAGGGRRGGVANVPVTS